MPEFADRLRSARRQAGLTQAEAARRVGVTRRTYERWEAGDTAPRNIARIARALEIPAARLTEDHDVLSALRQIARTLHRIEQKIDQLLGR